MGTRHQDQRGVSDMPYARKKVFQLDKVTGDIIAEHNGLGETAKATGVSMSQLGKCCRGVLPHACGFAWCYAEQLHSMQKAIKAKQKLQIRLSKAEAIEMLKKYQGVLSYAELSRKTGYTYEELQRLYDKHKIYRFGCDEDD